MQHDFIPAEIIDPDKKPVWEKPSFKQITDPDRIIPVLAKLTKLEYDRVRDGHAKALGIRVSTLDQSVEACRIKSGAPIEEPGKNGRAINLYEPEPWPEPVNGAKVLDEALGVIERFMSIRKEHAVTCALWAAHSHIFDVFSHSPRLAINAPAEGCGKTLLLQLVGGMVPRPEFCEMMKPAPFFRIVEKFRPVLLIDECDVFIREDSDLLAALNNGWQPLGGVLRCVGDDFEPRRFSTFTPVALGGVKIHKLKFPRNYSYKLGRVSSNHAQEDGDERILRGFVRGGPKA